MTVLLAGQVSDTSGRHARFRIEEVHADRVVIRDLGPWERHLTVTNDAEAVVALLAVCSDLGGRRLLYYDSADELTELLVRDGLFVGFASGVTLAPG